jgi:hypothetical protein
MNNRILLTTLSVRTSKSGRTYYVGYLAKAKLLGFPAAEPDKFGNEQIELFVVEPEQRGPQSPAAKPPERDAAPARMSRAALECRGASWQFWAAVPAQKPSLSAGSG